MRILSITAQKPDSTGSGVYFSQLLEQWARSGHRQAAVFGCYAQDEFQLPQGTALFPVVFSSRQLPFCIVGMSDSMPYPSTRYREMDQTMTQQFAASFYRAVSSAVDRLDPDVIVCHHLYLLTALVRSWFPERKVLAISHGTDLRQLEAIPLARELILEQIPRLQGILALHQGQREEIARIFRCPQEQIHVIGAGYDSTIFHPDERAVPGATRRLVFAGKLSYKKGVPSLLRALDRLPYAPDQLAVELAGGHGPQEEFQQICQLAQRCRYPVHLHGQLPQSELADLLRRSHVFILPSLSEGLPLVNLEALACGCRVVCTDLPGIAQWYDQNVPGHGIRFIRPPDTDGAQDMDRFEGDIAKALSAALDSPGRQSADLTGISWAEIAHKILSI